MRAVMRMLRALDSPPRAFLAIALTFGLPLTFLFPAFQGPDEQHHFCRAWQLSQGHFLPTLTTTPQPRSLATLESRYERLKFHSEQKVTVEQIWNDLSLPLDPDDTTEVRCAGGWYSPAAFPGQTAGVVIGRILHLPVLVILYLSRLCGFALALFILYLAIARSIAFQRVLFFAALLPMALCQTLIVSGDGQLIAWSFFLFAEIMCAIYDDDKVIDRRFVGVISAAAVLIVLIKPMYIASLLLLLAIPPKKVGGKRRLAALFAGISLGAIAVEVAWFAAYQSVSGPSPYNGVPQHELVMAQPSHFLFVMIRNFSYKTLWYMETFLGNPGWLDVHLPPPALFVLFFALSLVCLTDHPPRPVTWWTRFLAATAYFSATATLAYTMYRVYTPTGSPFIEGLQGRYFLPLVPVAAVVLVTPALRLDAAPEKIRHALYAFCIGEAALLTYSVADRYFGL